MKITAQLIKKFKAECCTICGLKCDSKDAVYDCITVLRLRGIK